MQIFNIHSSVFNIHSLFQRSSLQRAVRKRWADCPQLLHEPLIKAYQENVRFFIILFSLLFEISEGARLFPLLLYFISPLPSQCHSVHSPSKALLCTLALAVLLVGVVVIPLLVTKNIMIILEIPQHFCDVGGYYIREDIDLHWRCFAWEHSHHRRWSISRFASPPEIPTSHETWTGSFNFGFRMDYRSNFCRFQVSKWID